MIRSRLVSVKYMISALLALILAIGAVEVGLRVHDSWTGPAPAQAIPGQPFLVRSWRLHHELRPARRYTVDHPDRATSSELRINSFGLRGPEPAVPKPPGTYRVLCLGDEATLAPETDRSETFTARLEEQLQPLLPLRAEVINAGVPGYCPLLGCLQLRHSLLALQPDLVILNFDMSDVADDYRYRRYVHMDPGGGPRICPHPALAGRDDRGKRSWTDRLLLLRWLKDRLLDWTVLREPSGDRPGILAATGRYGWLGGRAADWSVYVRQAVSPIEHLNRMAADSHARFVVATYPVPWQVSPDAGSSELRRKAGVAPGAVDRSRAPFERLADYCERHGIPFCDTSPAFRQSERPGQLFLRNAARFSAAGHRLYARELAQFLRESVQAPWRQPPSDWGSPAGSPPAFSVNR